MCRWKCYLFHLLYFKILKKLCNAHSQYKLGKKINSEFPWRIESQTFRFHGAMLYHWATETLLFSFWLTAVTRWKKLSFSISLLTKDKKKMIINPVQSRVAQWRIIFSCGEQLTFHQSSLMSRNSHRSKNGRFDQILSNWVNVNGLDDFGQFLGKFVKTKSARQNWQILVKLIEVKSTQPIWQLDEFLPFLLLRAFLDITTLTNVNHMDLIKGGKFLRKLWCCASGRG